MHAKSVMLALMLLEVNTRRVEPGIIGIELNGRMTLGYRHAELEYSIKDMIQQGCRKLVIDLTKLDSMDSSGVGLLAMCAAAIKKAGGEMRVAGANARVSRVFEITRLDDAVAILADAGSACRSFGATGSDAIMRTVPLARTWRNRQTHWI